VFSVASDRLLTPVSGSPFTTGAVPQAVAFSSNGLLAAANILANTVSVFSVASDGTPTPVSGSPFGSTGNEPYSLAFGRGGALFATANLNVTGGGSVSVFSASPTAVINSPAGGGAYKLGQVVATSSSCADSPYGPGLASCIDSNGHSAPSGQLNTVAPGPHTYTVTATSADALTGAASISYTVVGAPTAHTVVPVPGARYTLNQVIDSSFSCSDAVGGPGIASCVDQSGHPSGASIDTSTTGAHTFTVTATSKDGQTGTASVGYTVAGPPTAHITSPVGGVYVQGQAIATSFTCTEGPSGPGLASCLDGTGHAAPTAVWIPRRSARTRTR
jgi:hypothetical protein